MNCPKCATPLPDDAQFCIECGAAVERAATGPTQRMEAPGRGPRCPTCATLNPAEAIFCVRCGRTLGEQPLAAAPSDIPQATQRPMAPLQSPAPPRRRVLPAPQVPVFAGVGRSSRRTSDRRLDHVAGAIFLFGLALLIFTHWLWPGILVLIGLTSALNALGRGRSADAFQALVWSVGLGILFATGRIWPGIVVLMVISALFGGCGRRWRH